MRSGLVLTISFSLLTATTQADDFPGVSRIDFFGYEDCVALSNETTRVVLCHQAGGRVLEYSLNGENVIYLNPKGAGSKAGDQRIDMTGGRFDIGPELVVPPRPLLWSGEWTVTPVGPRTAVMRSQYDPSAGVQLTREFALDETTSKLRVTQTIHNLSDQTREYCHWSRTFAVGEGVVLVPYTEPSGMPNKYVMYGPNKSIFSRPEDPNIRLRGGFVEILAAPKYAKLGMDSAAGWFTYLAPNDLRFTKQFSVDRNRVYSEPFGLTVSIWYPADKPMVELEPIGPREILAPNESASFTETWSLIEQTFPIDVPPPLSEIERSTRRQLPLPKRTR